MGRNAVLALSFHSNVPDRNFCQSIRLIGAELSISENIRSKVMVTTSPNVDKNTVLEPQLYSNISYRNFCQSTRLLGAALSISEI